LIKRLIFKFQIFGLSGIESKSAKIENMIRKKIGGVGYQSR